MSWEDGEGPDEPTEEAPLRGREIAPAQAPSAKLTTRITIEADQWDDQRLSEMILGRVASTVEERTQKAIERRIETVVDKAFREVVEARVTAAVDAILTEGWQPTDGYGRADGPKKTLKDLVLGMLTARDRYDNNRSYLDKSIADNVDKVLRGELGKAIEEAKAKVRETLDHAVMTKLQQALKEGLGLQT